MSTTEKDAAVEAALPQASVATNVYFVVNGQENDDGGEPIVDHAK